MKNLECEVFNTNNPYDEAGEKHNALLSEIEKNGNPEMDLDQVYELSDQVIKDEYGKDVVLDFSSKEFAEPILAFASYDDMQVYVKSLDTSDVEKELNLQLYDIMLKYDGTNVCEIIDYIKEFETAALEGNKAENIVSTLTSASIGRYSLSYWDSRVGEENFAGKGFWKKLLTGVADAIGGAAGAVAASATVIGAVAGAIVGGSAASTGFSKAWDLFAE